MNRKRMWVMFLGLVAILAIGYGELYAQDNADLQSMKTGNQLYENGEYSNAAQIYQQLVDQGIENDTLYFNLGNAYFKSGDLGHAILYYEKAARLNPRDDDVQTNLKLARDQRVDQYDKDSDFLTRLTQTVGSWLTLNELAILTLILWFSAILLLLVYFTRHPSRLKTGLFYGGIVTGLLFAASFTALLSQIYIDGQHPPAVIVAQEVDVQGGPGNEQVVEFTLHSGAEVRILEARGNWTRLELPGGELEGWVPAESVEAVLND